MKEHMITTLQILLALFAPIIGGIIVGIERVVRARMQHRQGPSLWQPFYDFFKLLDKRALIIHSPHAALGLLHFFAMWVTVACFFLGVDFLLVVFFHLIATSFLVLAGFSARSVFSHLGSHRQILSTLAYEPVLIFLALCFWAKTQSFSPSTIFLANTTSNTPLIVYTPLAFLAFLIVLPIKLKKSPFDIAEAHQEITGGAEIEFSGLFYEAIYTAKWLEVVFAYSILFLFGGWLWGSLLAIITFLAVNALDNATGRLQYQHMLKICLGIALPISVVNFAFLVL